MLMRKLTLIMKIVVAITLALTEAASLSSAEPSVAVAGAGDDESLAVSGHKYPVKIERDIGGKPTTLVITGAGQRTKTLFKVYTVGSYVQQGVAIKDAAELATQDCAKQLHIIMQRDVEGSTMAEALIDGIGLNHTDEQFVDQKAALVKFMAETHLKKGDEVWLTHVPAVGVHFRMPGDHETLIKDVPFSVAIWKIYLGKKNVSDDVKKGITARLPIAAPTP